jgi:hypothetical protein
MALRTNLIGRRALASLGGSHDINSPLSTAGNPLPVWFGYESVLGSLFARVDVCMRLSMVYATIRQDVL